MCWARLVAAAVFYISCTGHAATAGEIQTQTAKPYFILPNDEKRHLIESLKTIALGDSRDDVIRKLGKPDYDYVVAYKETGQFKSRRLAYYVYRVSSDANVNDQMVTLDFDKKDRLIWIFSDIKEYPREESRPQ